MMLAEPTAAASDLLSTANTISHELAHMWFGDIGDIMLSSNYFVQYQLLRYNGTRK